MAAGKDRGAAWFLGVLAATAIAVPILNQVLPASSTQAYRGEATLATASLFHRLESPTQGESITLHSQGGRLVVPDHPIIPFIEGAGTGPDIWRAARTVLEGAVPAVSKI